MFYLVAYKWMFGCPEKAQPVGSRHVWEERSLQSLSRKTYWHETWEQFRPSLCLSNITWNRSAILQEAVFYAYLWKAQSIFSVMEVIQLCAGPCWSICRSRVHLDGEWNDSTTLKYIEIESWALFGPWKERLYYCYLKIDIPWEQILITLMSLMEKNK